MSPYYADASVTVYAGDCLDVLRDLPDASVDAVVTDPPYDLTNRTPDVLGCEGCGRTLGGRDGKPDVCPRCGGELTRQRSAQGKGFMGKAWDGTGIAFRPAVWVECLRVLKPGGHLLAFGGTRTSHRLACAVEDAGFEIRDSIAWMYGSGFPKSLDVSKAIDKAARGVPQGGADPTSPNHGKFRTTTTEGKRWEGDSGQSYGAGGSRFLADTVSARTDAPSTATTPPTTRGDAAAADSPPTPTLDATATEWQGWGTALKPAHEPIVVARKPLTGTVAANVLAHGTGALNIDASRVEGGARPLMARISTVDKRGSEFTPEGSTSTGETTNTGRWPANVVLDESQAAALDEQSGERPGFSTQRDDAVDAKDGGSWLGTRKGDTKAGEVREGYNDTGGASRFFYTAKADADERVRINGVAHPTVKPLSLMRWLVRLVTPPGGVVLDPFAGSGTTVEACILEGFRCVAVEREAEYLPLITQRIHRRRDPVAAVRATDEDPGLFDLLGDDMDGGAA